jgi:putative ABC transport system permease protein
METLQHPARLRWIEDLASDLSYGIRSFRRNPTFALTALSCLALGIGANTLIFSLVHSILLRQFPYPDADRLAMVRFTPPQQPEQKFGTNAGSYFFIRARNHVFQSMGAVRFVGFSIAGSQDDPNREWVQGAFVTPGLTDTMGMAPAMGRWFSRDDTAFNIVISHRLWQRVFGGASDILGKKLYLDMSVATVVGVMPPGYQTLDPSVELWRLQTDENLANALRSPNRVFNLFARLKPGVTVQQAQAELATLEGPLGDEMDMNRGWGIKVDSLHDAYVGHLRQPLLIFQGAVFILLLIACANVASLLLAQATTRHRELAMRVALGSSRGRVIRQILTESVLLSLTAGALGIGLGWSGLRILTRFATGLAPEFGDAALDLTVFGFAMLLSLITGLVFGGFPAVRVSRTDPVEFLRDASRSATASGRSLKLRGAFVIAQVALAVVLLIGAGLLAHSLLRLNMVRPGLDPEGLVTFQIPFSRTLYRGAGNSPTGGLLVEMGPQLNLKINQVTDRIAKLPGVESVAAAMTPPLGGSARRFEFKRESQVLSASEQEAWTAEWYPVTSGYFATLRIPLIRGRDFSAADSETSSPVVIINTGMAQRFFPNEDPVGKRIQSGLLYDQPREIIGVVGDVRQNRYQYASQPQMYVPRMQMPSKMDMTLSFDVLVGTFIVRTHGNPANLEPLLRKAANEVDRTLALTNMRTVEQYAAGQLQDLRHYATLLSIFGGISILLCFVGLFGITAHSVSQRTHEIGIRVALGATSGSVLTLIARQGFRLILIGMLFGVVASLELTRVVERFLWGVTPTDPETFAAVLGAVLVVALGACYVPARRALRIDPIHALRSE